VFTNTSCGIPKRNELDILRSANNPDYPWTGVTFGIMSASVWYWCSDQVIVQRALAAKNLSHAKGGIILAAFLKFLPVNTPI
jgi:uncharacterized sodium:solute symporter family permease YidK